MSDLSRLRIWDIWVRLFHWSFAASVVFLLFSGETGIGFFDWHRWAGEFVLLLVLFRLFWGFLGSSNARLVPLLRHPVAALNHLRGLLAGERHDERGHNSAGGWAVLAMLLLVLVQAVTGLFIADEEELIEGAFYYDVSSGVNEFFYRIHHTNAELLQILVVIHVLMVLAYLIRTGQNLILPMLTGRMKWSSDKTPPAVVFAKPWLGLFFLGVCYLLLAWLLRWPPLF